MNVTFPKLLLLPVLACGLLLGASRGQTPAQQASVKRATNSGQQLLAAAARRLKTHPTIESKIRIRTELLGQPLVGTGKYAQLDSSSGLLLRLELAIQVGQQTTSVNQISDGRQLWEHWRIGQSERVNHIDLGRVARSLKQSPRRLSMSASNLATGGLPKLITQLAAHFDFDVQPVRDGELGGIEVVGLTGVWKADKLAAAAPQAIDGNKIVFNRLPAQLPHQVELILGKEDLFPYRVTYQKWEESESARLVSVVTTEFFEVTIGGVLDPSQFHYELPEHLQLADQTDVYLDSLGIASQPQNQMNR
jgi:hypothetical protein